jgi:lysophospholipid acyltransferase (LPLAT)-like uncharacterized protein
LPEEAADMKTLLRALLPAPAALLARGICATLRVRVLRPELEETFWGRGRNVIYAFWHGHLFYLMYRYRGSGVRILVSQSRDGEFLSRVLAHFGLPTIRGSSTRGGRRSFRKLVRHIRGGGSAAIAPDGPRGPRHRAQLGIIGLARLSGVPILPVAVGARWKVEFQSWDRFLLPLPCGRVVVVYDEPVVVPSNADAELLEQKRQELESKLLKLMDEVALAVRA